MRLLSILSFFFCCSWLVACGDDGRPIADTGTDTSISVDSSIGDATTDSRTLDTGSGDSSVLDSRVADSAVVDATVDGGADTAVPDAGPVSGQFVVDFLDIAVADASTPGVVRGMDLDGRVSDASDAAGCFHPDFTSPAPDSETGVDNQLGPIVSALGSSFTVDFAPFIASGDLIILAQVRGSGATTTIELLEGEVPGGGAPTLTGAGTLAPGQTFDVVRSLGIFGGAETAGRTRVGPRTTTLPIIPGAAPITVYSTQVYGTVTATGIADGVVGAAADVMDGVATITMLDPTIPSALVNSILSAQADLAPDASGACQRISAGLEYTAVTASFTP